MNTPINYIEEEMTIAEFAERFLGVADFSTPVEIDIASNDIEIYSKDLKTGTDEYNKILKFIVKPEVDEYYSDGNLNGTDLHRIIENGKDIHLKDHPDFKKICKPMKVVDFEVNKTENYYANGRLNHNTVSGGKALAYHCSVRVRLNNTGKLKKGDEVIGNSCKAVVIKNRMGPPNRQAEFDIYYDSGVADYAGWLDVLKKIGAVKQAGAYYKFTNDQGTEEQFQSKEFVSMMQTNKALRDKFYSQICSACIMKYRDPNSVIEDVVVESESDLVDTENE